MVEACARGFLGRLSVWGCMVLDLARQHRLEVVVVMILGGLVVVRLLPPS